NVVTYTAQLDGQDYLVVNGNKHAVDGRILGGVRYVGKSDIFAAPYYRSSGGIKWIIGDGEWLESHSDNLYSPKVYPPVTSDDRSTVAVRAQHGDQWFVHEGLVTSEPATWASQPVAIPGKRAVAYRYGDRETTTVVINGSKVGVHDWARNPIFNEEGTNYAYAIGIGGQPTKKFNAICNRDPKDDSVAGILHGPAYSGGTYNMVFNRKVGPPFAFVEDPIFNPAGTDIAYAVKLDDGKSAVHHNGTTSAGYKYVDSITFDRPGTGMAFVGTRDSLRYLVSNGKESAGHKSITQVTGGAAGTFAYVNTNAQDLEFLTIGWSALGPFESIDEVGFMPDGRTAFARVRHEGKVGVLIGHEVTRWFDEIQSFTTSQDHPTPTYMARDGEAWHVITGNQVGPAFEKLQKPIVLGDGRVVYLALTFESKPGPTEGAPDVKEPKHHVIVDGKAQPSCIVRSDVTASPDGFRAYYRAELEPGVHSIVEIGGRTYTPKDAKLDYVMFDEESRLVIHEVGDGYHRLVIDHVTQPAFDDLSLYSIRSTPSPLTASVTEGDKEAFVSGSLTTGYFDLVTDPIFSANGQTLACRGRTDGSWHLAIGRWTSDRYDDVFPPRFTQDGKSVQCAVRVGSDLMRLTVHLDEVDWQ
ncbi:MAG: hypothetical protein P1V35_15700, partial [Planctomycetota bacterium]|nr:hypothetical protein [Planctomycetota bacterium]